MSQTIRTIKYSGGIKMSDTKNPEGESRRERFVRLAASRTNAVLSKIRVLGNCSNKVSYEFTKEDVEKIFSRIHSEIALVEAKFSPKQQEENIPFTLEAA